MLSVAFGAFQIVFCGLFIEIGRLHGNAQLVERIPRRIAVNAQNYVYERCNLEMRSHFNRKSLEIIFTKFIVKSGCVDTLFTSRDYGLTWRT